jgi:hypothetical protein
LVGVVVPAVERFQSMGLSDIPPCPFSALGKIRTCDTRFRKPVLYPLSYEGKSL